MNINQRLFDYGLTWHCHTGYPFLDGGSQEPLRCYWDGQETKLEDFLGPLPPGSKLHHFGVSGGKDSIAALLWAIHVKKLDPGQIIVSACDTGNEHKVTYEQIALVHQRLHALVVLVPGLDFWGLVDRKRMFPTRKKRFCTQYLKMQPTQRFVHALEDLGHEVIMYSGVRAAESAERAALPEEEWDPYFGVTVVRPLLKMSLADVIALHREYNFPLNPLYGWGARRVGCFPCINSVKEEMRIVPQVAPEKVTQIRQKEVELSNQTGEAKTFFHRKTVPVRFRTVKFKAKDGRQMLVCSINDVVQWARWLNKSEVKKLAEANQNEMPFVEDSFQSCSASQPFCE